MRQFFYNKNLRIASETVAILQTIFCTKKLLSSFLKKLLPIAYFLSPKIYR
ncbi:MAG: hypothetical protein LBP59_04700 [Planctomycetaceae bacterium]|nr:hypothetical protein [Planctomycetaceae bacterium]